MTTFVNKKQNPLRIRPGDTVNISFAHIPRDPAFFAEVLEIMDRTDIGQDAMITYRRLDGQTNEPRMPDACSVSHVRSVTHGPYKVDPSSTPINIFRDQLFEERKRIEEDGCGWRGVYNFGGIRIGYRERLVVEALACATDDLTRQFVPERFEELWKRAGCPGKVTSPNEDEYPSRRYTCVRWKVFKRWVLTNRHRLLASRKEIEEFGQEYLRVMEEMDEEDMMRDLDLGSYVEDANAQDDRDYYDY